MTSKFTHALAVALFRELDEPTREKVVREIQALLDAIERGECPCLIHERRAAQGETT